MRLAGENGEILDVEPLAAVVPGELRPTPRRAGKAGRRGCSAAPSPRRWRIARSGSRPSRRGARRESSLNAIGPSTNSGGGFLSNVSRSARLTSRASSASDGWSPVAARASIVQRPAGPVADMRASPSSPSRSKTRLKSWYVTVRPVASLSISKRALAIVSRSSAWLGAGHGVGAGADERGEVQAFEARRLARQGDRRCRLVARRGDRQRAVGGDPEAQARDRRVRAAAPGLRRGTRQRDRRRSGRAAPTAPCGPRDP